MWRSLPFLALILPASLALAAPPGYVDDRECARCHRQQWDSYQHVGMARSFYKPRKADAIESFDGKPFFHEKSGQYFEMVWRGDRLVFRRWLAGADGKPVNVFEQAVDWIIGSGHHARTYLYQTPGGELYQLPINWYSQTQKWGMAPGYDRRDHEGVLRRVRHECMFCHNAYAATPPEPNPYWRTQTFPRELPEGVGCQRCHGPGARHITAVDRGIANEIHSSIVNPSRLDARRRNDVCYECHMQASVILPGLRRYGRDIYSFRPGQTLSDYALHLDVTERGVARSERFEINHHPYRLEQSRCFRESDGKLSCLSCHDPHRKVPPAERAAHYRAVCMSCHKEAHHADADCTTCHMPARRTQDVVNVVMTDHFIRRTPGGPELLAPLQERDPDLEVVDFRDRTAAPTGALGDMYRASAVMRASGGSSTSALATLKKTLAQLQPAETEPYLDAIMGLLKKRDYAEVEKTALLVLERDPKNAQALEWLGLARYDLGKHAEGIAAIESSLAIDSTRAEAHYNIGLLLRREGRDADAIPHLLRATQLRPNFALAWFHLGEAYAKEKREEDARAAYRRTLEIDPTHKRASAALAGR